MEMFVHEEGKSKRTLSRHFNFHSWCAIPRQGPSMHPWGRATKQFYNDTSDVVVMGGDSCVRRREFESQLRILNDSFSHLLLQEFIDVWKDRK